ncbi:MAG TPA: DEAD/DEAH box helicase family protein [Solirubrobacteraceae bacterium]|nr:DEAD/DEAH box helicase family protein [Solirubrobacteraceae bacterium]
MTDPDDAYLAREARARREIDKQLAAAGWTVQGKDEIDVNAGHGVATREFPLEKPHGRVDYLLFVNGQPVGVIEAKAEGTTLVEVEHQSGKYVEGLPGWMETPVYPLPFIYESTGTETRFTNGYDPDARSRRVFSFHRPDTLAEWARQIRENQGAPTLRARLKSMPELNSMRLWEVQATAIANLEESLRENRPRALIQMATGSGKTFTAANISYRLIRHADAKRILFLVDRANLGEQAKLEFDKFDVPDTQRKFPAEYNIQHLKSNTVDAASRVCISTIQRIFSILRGDEEMDEETDEHSVYELPVSQPMTVEYNWKLPPDTFDVIIVDECHRSIYGVWRQVLEYFDAYLIGLTATPTKQTYGFFRQNLVMEYSHELAVADGVNVDFTVYIIKTAITESGSTIDTGEFAGYRNRMTRKLRWEAVDEPIGYTGNQLDRAVVAEDQIRTVLTTFKEKLFTELFPGRTTVPKTLIFAKDDSHADDIVQMVREVFGKGNDFATKITYRSRDGKPNDLLQSFRNSLYPRIVVTVDMIATGTDVKPLECLLFMRSVKSRTYFEQMVGRGVRVIDDTDFQDVTDDAQHKDRFVVVDAVGITDTDLMETLVPLERKPSASLKDLMKLVGFGNREPEVASTLAGRLARLDAQLPGEEREMLAKLAGGVYLGDVARGIVEALDPDTQLEAVRQAGGDDTDEEAVAQMARGMIAEALKPLSSNPELRKAILDARKSFEQTIDEVSQDTVLVAGHSDQGREKAAELVGSFRQYIEEHKDDIRALQVLYSRPYSERPTFAEIKDLATTIQRPPRQWTPERLWRAYEMLDQSKVRGSGGGMLTDIVSLVRYTLDQDDELVPFRDQVDERFAAWLLAQEQGGVSFTEEQLQWLTWMKENIAAEMGITAESFQLTPFAEHGGIGKAVQIFGERLTPITDELTEVLAA